MGTERRLGPLGWECGPGTGEPFSTATKTACLWRKSSLSSDVGRSTATSGFCGGHQAGPAAAARAVVTCSPWSFPLASSAPPCAAASVAPSFRPSRLTRDWCASSPFNSCNSCPTSQCSWLQPCQTVVFPVVPSSSPSPFKPHPCSEYCHLRKWKS